MAMKKVVKPSGDLSGWGQDSGDITGVGRTSKRAVDQFNRSVKKKNAQVSSGQPAKAAKNKK